MSQHDYNIQNDTAGAVRADINSVLTAIVSNNSGTTEPATMFAYMLWADTTNNLLKIRNAANNAWITMGSLSLSNLGLPAADDLPRWAATVGGTANAITLTPAQPITSYVNQTFIFKATGANTTATTVNVSGLGTKTIKNILGNDLITGDIASGQICIITYDGTNFILGNKPNVVLDLPEQSSAPSNPVSGRRKLYVKTDGKPYILSSAGTENPLPISTAVATYAPTINGSTTNVTLGTGAVQQGTWWRMGQFLFCDVTIVLGTSPTAGSGNAQIPTPGSVTIDTSALGTGARQIVGSGYVQTGGAGSNFPVAVVASTSNVTYVMMEVITGTGTSLNAASAYNTVGNFIKIQFVVPIVGW